MVDSNFKAHDFKRFLFDPWKQKWVINDRFKYGNGWDWEIEWGTYGAVPACYTLSWRKTTFYDKHGYEIFEERYDLLEKQVDSTTITLYEFYE